MELTDLEKQEFLAMAADTFDPEIWDESDYLVLKSAKRGHEADQSRERGDIPAAEQPAEVEDDEADAAN